MELRQYFNIVWRWAWLVILSVVIAAGSSYLASRRVTPLYRTKTTLMVGRATQNPDPNSTDLYTGQQLAYTYSQLARREPVLKGTIESLGLQMSWGALAGQISTNIVPNTQLLEISVVDVDPYRAKVLADAIAQQLILQSPAGANTASEEDIQFINDQKADLQGKIKDGQEEIKRLKQERDAANSALQISDLQNQINLLETKINGWQSTYSQLLASLQGGNINTLTVVEEATVPYWPISPNVKMNVLIAAAIGLILSVGGIVLIEYLDDTIKTPEDIKRITDLPTMGTISRIEGKDYADRLIAANKPVMPAVEAFRSLRSNIQYSSIENPICSLLITSPNPAEGKSICLANLAVVMAQAGMKVVVIDADFRRPVQDQIFRVSNNTGLSDLMLYDHLKVDDLLQDTDIENLQVVTTGPQAKNIDKLVVSDQMKEVLQKLEAKADVVLVDSPPVLVAADAAILSTKVDGVLMVVDAGKTHFNDAKRAMYDIRRVHSNLMGVILNRYDSHHNNYYYYYYHKNGKEKKKNKRASSREENRISKLTGQNIPNPVDEDMYLDEIYSRLRLDSANHPDSKVMGSELTDPKLSEDSDRKTGHNRE